MLASCICFPKLKRDSDAIERIQRRATKLVSELCTLTYTERLRQLKLPTLVYRRRRADMLHTYKLMHYLNQLDQDMHCPVCRQKHDSAVSNPLYADHNLKSHTQEVERVRSNFFAARVIRYWNYLANRIVHAKSINIFKAKLRHEWINHTELYICILIAPESLTSSLYVAHITVNFYLIPTQYLWVNIDGGQGIYIMHHDIQEYAFYASPPWPFMQEGK